MARNRILMFPNCTGNTQYVASSIVIQLHTDMLHASLAETAHAMEQYLRLNSPALLLPSRTLAMRANINSDYTSGMALSLLI